MNESITRVYANKSILVTGGTGYIGSALVEALCEADCAVARQGRTSVIARWPVAVGKTGLVREWVSSIAEMTPFDFCGFDLIFHLAGQTSVWVADKDIVADWEANVAPMLHLLQLSRTTGHQPPIVFAGTATMYGLTNLTPVVEGCPMNPLTIYDIHKHAAAAYLALFRQRDWARGATLVLPNVYGPSPAMSSARDRGMLNATIAAALRGEDLKVYDGGGRRDWLYIEDAVDAFLHAGASLLLACLPHSLYIVSSRLGIAIYAVMHMVAEGAQKIAGHEVKVLRVPHPNPHPSGIDKRNYAGDGTRFYQDTGWVAQTHVHIGIEKTMRWMVEDEMRYAKPGEEANA